MCQVWPCMCAWDMVVRVCAPLASLSPGHHMQSLEPRPAPSVGLMPSLSPEQLSPTSLIILAGTMQKNHNRHTHTQRTHKDIRSERQTQLMEPRTITQWQSRQSLPGKVFLKLILAVWAGVRWTLPTRIHYSQRSSLQLDKLPISEVKWSGEELHFLGFISLE